MFASPRSLYLLLVLIAFVPGALSWWSGRQLARRLNDPGLPDLLAAHRQRHGVVLVGAMCVLGLVAGVAHVNLTVFGVVGGVLASYAGCVAAAYPLRRVLYEETWTFRAYCLYFSRAVFGLFGFWLLAATLPSIAALSGPLDWLVAAAIGSVLVLWNSRYSDILRYCLGTQSLPEGNLLAGCRRLAVVCNLPDARFERIPLGGGVIANALALPSRHTPTVLFTDTVLERFDEEEILGVCAHELAHFEHYNPARLRRLNIANYTMIALGAISAPAARLAGAEWGVLMTTLWFVAVACSMAMRARGKQQQETACDLRAVALTGNPEALVRALTKLYMIARLPRRLAVQTEQAATHPSLARRIRDIRNAGQCAPAPVPSGSTFASVDDQTVVTFRDDGVAWAEVDVATHELRYEHLSELRVEYSVRRGARLLARGTKAGRWEMRVREHELGAIQSVLDAVDGRLAEAPRATGIHPRAERLIILGAATFLLTFSQFAAAAVALLGSIRPTMPMLVGTGLSVMTGAALLVRDHGPRGLLTASSVPLIGLILLGLAWAGRSAQREQKRSLIAVLSLAAACSVLGIVADGVDAVWLHRHALDAPSATVFLVALAGTLAASPTRRARAAGVAVAIVALATVGIASTAFLDRFGSDPLLVEAPPVRWVALPSNPIRTFDVPSDTMRIELSPSGDYLALRRDLDRDDESLADVQVGRIGGSLISIRAEDVAFVSDEQLLVVQSVPRGMTLQAERLNAAREVIWSRGVEYLSEPSLSIDRATGRWDLVGWDRDDSLMRVQGVLGTTAIDETRWQMSQGRDGYVTALTTAGADALVLRTRYDRSGLGRALPGRWSAAYLLFPSNPVSIFVTANERGEQTIAESKLDVDCVADTVQTAALACTAYDGRRTRILRISPAGGQIEPVASLNGHFVTGQYSVRGWLTGWVNARPVAIHVTTGDAFLPPRTTGMVRLLPVGSDRLATLQVTGDHQLVRVYAIPPEARYVQSLGFQPSR